MADLRYRMLSDLRAHGYPTFVQRVYLDHVADYTKFFMKSPDLLGPEDIRAYQTHILQEKRVAGEILGDVVAALRLLYNVTLGKNWRIEPVAGACLSLRQRMLEDMRVRNLSESVQYTYLDHVTRLAKHFGKSPHLLGPEDVRQYMVYLAEVERADVPTRRLAACSLRFFYRVTLGRSWMIDSIPYAQRLKKLPEILSVEEVRQFFASIHDIKHLAMILPAYAGGLRLSEIIHLKVADVDSNLYITCRGTTTALPHRPRDHHRRCYPARSQQYARTPRFPLHHRRCVQSPGHPPCMPRPKSDRTRAYKIPARSDFGVG